MLVFAVPYADILSATLLEKLPLMARIARWSRRKKGGLAIALHTYSSKRKRPAQWDYICLTLISQAGFGLSPHSPVTSEMECHTDARLGL